MWGLMCIHHLNCIDIFLYRKFFHAIYKSTCSTFKSCSCLAHVRLNFCIHRESRDWNLGLHGVDLKNKCIFDWIIIEWIFLEFPVDKFRSNCYINCWKSLLQVERWCKWISKSDQMWNVKWCAKFSRWIII